MNMLPFEPSKRLPIETLCVHCGPGVAVDEDGCCRTCGADAVGPWADRMVAVLRNLGGAVAEDPCGYCGIFADAVLTRAGIELDDATA